MAKLLLEKGAEINFADGRGDTMLATASHQGNLEAIRFLIGHGAAINARNVDGKTALGVAEQMQDLCGRDYKECRPQIRKYDRIVAYIRQHGGIR
jgi:ankyrin repeat protein